MTNPKQTILIIDDHSLFADGLSLILQSGLDGHKTVVMNNAHEALIDTSKLSAFELVLIDLHMPNMDGFTFLSAIAAQKLSIRVAVISGTESNKDVERAIALGACGFIPKDSPSIELVSAVKILLDKKMYIPDAYCGEINLLPNTNAQGTENELTERQLQVLKLMKEGLKNKQIAMVLGVSVSAVKGHVEKLFRALNVNNRTSCLRVAEQKKLFD